MSIEAPRGGNRNAEARIVNKGIKRVPRASILRAACARMCAAMILDNLKSKVQSPKSGDGRGVQGVDPVVIPFGKNPPGGVPKN